MLRKKIARPIRFNAYTVCIGNVTVGGTGKTQLVIALAKELAKRGVSFIIISKGYGGNNKRHSLVTETSSPYEVGDEALELCSYGTTFVLSRIWFAPEIISKYRPSVVLVDDGMQNPNFIKDYIITTIDGLRGFGNGMLIPAGPLRSTIDEAFAITDSAVIVCGDEKSRHWMSKHYPEIKVYDAHVKPITRHSKAKYFAFSGIGNPEKFYNTLADMGLDVVRTRDFPDHYFYSKNEIFSLIREAQELGLRLITTRKDYVKIRYSYYESSWSLSQVATEFVGASPKSDSKKILPVDYLEVELEIENIDTIVDGIIKGMSKRSLVKAHPD